MTGDQHTRLHALDQADKRDAGLPARRAEPVAQWQPIETAPQDGKPVLLANHGWIGTGWWDEERGEWWQTNHHWTDVACEALYPQHWMPLPAAPGATPPQPADAAIQAQGAGNG